MKKITFALLIGLFCFGTLSVNAQTENKIEITPVVGYQFGGKVQFYEGDFKMDNAMNYGINLNVLLKQHNRIELTYSYMGTTANFRPYASFVGDFNTWAGDLNIHYITIGSHSELPMGQSPVTLFGGISLGAAIMDIKEPNVSDIWRFALGITGGLKIGLTDRIGIRLQGRMLMPMYFAGVGMYVGVGTGGASTGLSMNAGVIAIQGDFQGGLVFGF